jgi:hypothetical protein
MIHGRMNVNVSPRMIHDHYCSLVTNKAQYYHERHSCKGVPSPTWLPPPPWEEDVPVGV